MDYLKFLRIINDGYDPVLLLGKGGLNYRPKRNISGGTLKYIDGKYYYEPDPSQPGPPSEFSELGRIDPAESDFHYSDPEFSKQDFSEYAFEEPEESKQIQNIIEEEEPYDYDTFKDFINDTKYTSTKDFEDFEVDKRELIDKLFENGSITRKQKDKLVELWYKKLQSLKEENSKEEKKILELERLKNMNPYEEFKEDTLHKELMEKDELDKIDDEEWDELKDENEEIAELDEKLQFDSLENNIHEIKTNVIGASNDKDFEDKLAKDENTYIILENLVDGFNRNDVEEIKVMNTGPRGEDIEFDGVKYPCPKDENYPIDLVAFIKTKSDDILKYAIEAKYYNGNKFGKEKENFTYKDICDKRMEDFDEYKKNTLVKIVELEEEIEDLKDVPKPNKKKIEKLTSELQQLKEITSTKEKFIESFDRNEYGYFIPMKFTKGGYRFETEIEPDNLGYHKPEFYSEHMKKFKVGQPVIFFNKDGSIKGVKKTLAEYIKDKNGKPIGVKDTGFVEDRYGNKRSLEGFTEHLPQYNILKDCKVLYTISFRDTVVGDNYSKRISQNPELRKNPFYSHHVVKSAYGKSQTESIGLKPQNLKVINKIAVKKRHKS